MKFIIKSISLCLFSLSLSASVSMVAVADDNGHCTGTVSACSVMPPGKCTNQTGCIQKLGADGCFGIAMGCVLVLNVDQCKKQVGCAWTK